MHIIKDFLAKSRQRVILYRQHIAYKEENMSRCTFFGHRYIFEDIKPLLYDKIKYLINVKGVDDFYVGNQGQYDTMVLECLMELKREFPHIKYLVVLAYLSRNSVYLDKIKNQTIFPEELDSVPPKFAIERRNLYMIDKSDYVITYVKDIVGGAAKFQEIAKRKGKTVYNIAEQII